MNRRRFAALVLLLSCALCGFLLSVPGFAQQTTKLTHLELARILARELRPEETSYQHKQGYIIWKGENGAESYQSHVDCSGLLNALLERAYGITSNDFEKWLGKRRPLASEYFNAITQQQNFRAITLIGNVKPGDIIAIRYPPGTNENTGHIMIVNDVPSRRKPSKPEVGGTEQWEVSVIDSSESGHGKTDTRRKQDGSFGDGVGQGILRIYSDTNSEIVGYTWSTLGVSEYYDQHTRQLVIGRIQLPLRL
ncbi:MAG TPA: hypothetical protein VIX17_02700 [Pyrinomonadaceae bacterium]